MREIVYALEQLAKEVGGLEQAFDPGVAIRQATALHGLLICVGEACYDEAISGQEVLLRAERYIAEKFAEHGISTEKVHGNEGNCFTENE